MIKNKIVLVPFPFDDLSDIKIRPACCLTNEVGGNFNQVIIAFISSKIPSPVLNSDYIINKNNIYFKKTGLLVESVMRLHKIVTIPIKLIKRELGVVPVEMQKEINEKIKGLFNLD